MEAHSEYIRIHTIPISLSIRPFFFKLNNNKDLLVSDVLQMIFSFLFTIA